MPERTLKANLPNIKEVKNQDKKRNCLCKNNGVGDECQGFRVKNVNAPKISFSQAGS